MFDLGYRHKKLERMAGLGFGMLVFGEVGVRVKREEHKKYKEEKSGL